MTCWACALDPAPSFLCHGQHLIIGYHAKATLLATPVPESFSTTVQEGGLLHAALSTTAAPDELVLLCCHQRSAWRACCMLARTWRCSCGLHGLHAQSVCRPWPRCSLVEPRLAGLLAEHIALCQRDAAIFTCCTFTCSTHEGWATGQQKPVQHAACKQAKLMSGFLE